MIVCVHAKSYIMLYCSVYFISLFGTNALHFVWRRHSQYIFEKNTVLLVWIYLKLVLINNRSASNHVKVWHQLRAKSVPEQIVTNWHAFTQFFDAYMIPQKLLKCWLVDWALGYRFSWNFNQNSYLFIEYNAVSTAKCIFNPPWYVNPHCTFPRIRICVDTRAMAKSEWPIPTHPYIYTEICFHISPMQICLYTSARCKQPSGEFSCPGGSLVCAVCWAVSLVPIRFWRIGHDRMVSTLNTAVGE